jgi:hypothetical protein
MNGAAPREDMKAPPASPVWWVAYHDGSTCWVFCRLWVEAREMVRVALGAGEVALDFDPLCTQVAEFKEDSHLSCWATLAAPDKYGGHHEIALRSLLRYWQPDLNISQLSLQGDRAHLAAKLQELRQDPRNSPRGAR